MLIIRKSEDRGQFNYSWLNAAYTFSFSNYYDPNFMGFRNLRVINEDHIKGGGGFPTHSHNDMEIMTYVIDGGLSHKDSMNNSAIIQPGEVQIMSAGTGITHSEFNSSDTDLVHLLQIWIIPDQVGLKPRYDQRNFNYLQKENKLKLIVSPQGKDDSMTIHQDVNIYASVLTSGEKIEYNLTNQRYGWVQVIKGKMLINDLEVNSGDGVAIEGEDN
ncbi:MAG TPA: pirin family protein, partial [Allocoleopsis sp.]